MNTEKKCELKIAIVPLDIIFNEVQVNLESVKNIVSRINRDVDVIVLPELFSTGFLKNAEIMASMAESCYGPTISTLKTISHTNKVAICGSFACKENNQILNRAFFIKPDGKTHFYDKHHLFTMGGEHEIFSAGKSQPEIINFRGWNIMVSVCYDIRFPAWIRNKNLKYDVLIVPANWAHSRIYAWEHLLIARAIENQAFVIGCNRSGKDDYGEYPVEDSFAFNHWGKEISIRNDGIVYCTLDAEKLDADRRRFSPWRDADDFIITDC